MKTELEARRQKLLGELAQVNRQIAKMQEGLAQIEARITMASEPMAKAA